MWKDVAAGCRIVWRLGQIARILVKIAGPAVIQRILRFSPSRLSTPVRIRILLETLGITYVKLGQYAAMRHDIVPSVLTRELDKLFESVPSVSDEVVRKVIEAEFGCLREEAFASFNPVPIATASIAQVHRAKLNNGCEVAVKVQRPGVDQLLADDILILRCLGWIIDVLGLTGTLSAKEIVQQFSAFTTRELDFQQEGITADRLREEGSHYANIPRIHWPMCSRRILVMDFVEGLSLSRILSFLETDGMEALKKELPLYDADQVLENLTRASLHQLFANGFFHGDPHPGNIIVGQNNKVSFVDFGIFGELSDHDREMFANYVISLSLGRVHRCYRFLSRIYAPTSESNPVAFRHDTIEALGRWHCASRSKFAPLAERHIGRSFDIMVEVVQRHSYRTNMTYLLFWRTLIVLDGVALKVSNRFDLTAEVRKFFAESKVISTFEAPFLMNDRQHSAILHRVFRNSTCPTSHTGLRQNGMKKNKYNNRL